jgi:hypothetical protein
MATAARLSSQYFDLENPQLTEDSWWTTSNVQGFGTQIIAELAGVAAVEVVIGIVVGIVGVMGGPEFVVLSSFGLALVSLIGLGSVARSWDNKLLSALTA